MKPSSGLAPRAAALATAMLCGMVLTTLPGAGAQAQQVSTAVADGTPRIDTLISNQNWSAALIELDARIKSNPRDTQAKFKRGTVLARLNRDNEAIQQFAELTQAYPELPEPYNNLAALYAKAGRYEDARVALETAVKTNPSYGLAYDNLGDLYLQLAAQSYKRAQSLGQASGSAAQRLADLQKIIAAPGKPAAATASASAPEPALPVTTSPSFQYGGSNAALAMPPYVAPSH